MTKLLLDGRLPILMATVLWLGQSPAVMADGTALSLAGTWSFQLDAKDVGKKEKWFSRKLEDSVQLPGTTDENHKGIQQDERPTDRLARPWFWKGPAWYQREVTIPESWSGKRITLYLERTKNTRVWVDDTFCGWDDTLSAPHIHDVTKAIAPGKHTITLLVDNSILPPVGPAHQIDERTQTNWNGVVGIMELQATDPVWIEDAQAFPNAVKKEAKMRVVVGNSTGKPAKGMLKVSCTSTNTGKPEHFATQTVKVEAREKETVVEFTYQPGDHVPLWSEFHPAMLKLDLQLDTAIDDSQLTDRHSLQFGMRDFKADRNRLKINGKGVFLRGRLDCANFPLTGYAPMDKSEWRCILGTLREWGLNHARFHSWCPPRAAFEAADELGFYFQVELPNKRSGFNAPETKEARHWNIDDIDVDGADSKVSLYEYGKREGELILRHFGNHPSFVMFTLGNELGRSKGMFELVSHFKALDPRHLYAQGSNNMHWNPSLAEGDDFWVTGKIEDKARPIRGSFSLYDFPNSPIETSPPSTLDDFSRSIEGIPVPMVGHETGQYQVSPDFEEIPKYTGVLKARNYEIFRERLTEAGMSDQAPLFVRASAALSEICYREDMEMALRTPGFGGFQLLDIMDFPGQGTAPVGMLNVFMEPKPGVDRAAWRESCSPTVPLLRMKKHTWTTEEIFHGRVQVAHYGPDDLPDAHVKWTLGNSEGMFCSGILGPVDIKQGDVTDIDMFCLPLAGISTPQRMTLTLTIEGVPAGAANSNSYPLWIYPPKVSRRPLEGVIYSQNLSDEETKAHLEGGGKVLLIPPHDRLPHSVPGMFQTEFWSPMFAKSAIKRGVEPPPGTLGILCDPKHPAFSKFPTGFHTDWQWWHIIRNSRPVILDGTPDDYRPICQVIDNFDRNHKLGLLFETKVGKGSVLVCTINLPAIHDKPEARQLLHSLLHYIGSPDFAPRTGIDPALLRELFP